MPSAFTRLFRLEDEVPAEMRTRNAVLRMCGWQECTPPQHKTHVDAWEPNGGKISNAEASTLTPKTEVHKLW